MEKAELWKRRVAEQRTGGESISRYCRRIGVSESAFGYWRKKLASHEGRFVEVTAEPRYEVTVELPSGVKIRVLDQRQLRSVLEVVNARA